MPNGEILSFKAINEKREQQQIIIQQSLPGLKFEVVWQCEFPPSDKLKKYELFKASLYGKQPKKRMSVSDAIISNSFDAISLYWSKDSEPDTTISHLDLNSSFSFQEC